MRKLYSLSREKAKCTISPTVFLGLSRILVSTLSTGATEHLDTASLALMKLVDLSTSTPDLTNCNVINFLSSLCKIRAQ